MEQGHIDWATLAIQIFIPLMGFFLITLTVFTKMGITYLSKRTSLVSNAQMRETLDKLVSLAGQKVLMMEQTIVAGLKADVESGKVSRDDLPKLLQSVKARTVAAIKRDASAMGVWKTGCSTFGNSQEAIERWLEDVIESQVAQLKPAGLKSPVTSGLVPSEPSVPVAASQPK